MTSRHEGRFHRLPPLAMFYLCLSFILGMVLAAVYFGMYLRNNHLLRATVAAQAASYFDLIVTTRGWGAQYGGVYAEKKPGIESNPYLRQVGVEPDVTTTSGQVLTLKNPALMTREISERLSTSSQVQFRITSLRLLNPKNAPDQFERESLEKFASGVKEVSKIESTPDGPKFRYMAPLRTEQSCLRCHGYAGYKVGDIRGGISVSVPYNTIANEQKRTAQVIALLGALTLLFLLGSAYLMLNYFARRLQAAQHALEQAAITDVLTGLHNRRYVMTRLLEELDRSGRKNSHVGVLMIDVDRFKSVNDTYGHLAGDDVLKEVAARIRNCARPYDTAARYGGEEFLVIAPDMEASGLQALAERIRQQVANTPVPTRGQDIPVTISIGATVSDPKQDTVDSLTARADLALYQAKDSGRNRRVFLESSHR